MNRHYNWRISIPNEVFEACSWCADNYELWLSEIEAELDRRFWSRL